MSSIAKLLQTEITRLAREELKAEITSLRKRAVDAQSLIDALHRRVEKLESQTRLTMAQAPLSAETSAQTVKEPQPQRSAMETAKLRFSVKGFSAQRRRLGLTAEEAGRILNVSALSIYKWESGKVKPRARHLQAIAEFRKLGKRSVADVLKTLK